MTMYIGVYQIVSMDGDTIDDSVSGIVASDLALHGVAKIDDLQTAIINKVG
jgi:hypothetical protein